MAKLYNHQKVYEYLLKEGNFNTSLRKYLNQLKSASYPRNKDTHTFINQVSEIDPKNTFFCQQIVNLLKDYSIMRKQSQVYKAAQVSLLELDKLENYFEDMKVKIQGLIATSRELEKKQIQKKIEADEVQKFREAIKKTMREVEQSRLIILKAFRDRFLKDRCELLGCCTEKMGLLLNGWNK